MTIFIQLHLLTFVPPANLNRDDTGAPKTAMIGGDMRLRLSSQSLKRAWRESDIFKTRLDGHLGTRTQRFGDKIRARLLAQGLPDDKATAVTREVIVAFGKPKAKVEKDDGKQTYTEQLAFLAPGEQEAALALADRIAKGDTVDPKKVAGQVLQRADTAADIAMFGRMFADNPDFNREAAVQVAHAVTTHRVAIEDDYYTAVDDLNSGEKDVGAGFVGEAGFGSGVFYLYLCIDTAQLLRNLGGDEDLAKAALGALVEAAASVAPSGKQASFASRPRASFVLAEKGSDQPRTLAAAFAKALPPHDALAQSKKKLFETREAFNRAYGAEGQSFAEMDVEAGQGSLAALVAFASDWAA
jgi:CRISPR system Cascade subunit CasC